MTGAARGAAALAAGLGAIAAVVILQGGDGAARGGAGTTERQARPGGQASERPDSVARATFAGGCFWCMEPPFDRLEGVLSTTSGYAGGHVEDPTYEQVASGGTGHREVVQVAYDPGEVGYETLLHVFWRNVDPTDGGGQFCDRGHQYTTAVFYHDRRQERLAEASREELVRSGRFDEPVVTEILPLEAFYPAEEYHQDYYREHALRYKFYRYSCGRDRVLERLWGEEAGGEHPPG